MLKMKFCKKEKRGTTLNHAFNVLCKKLQLLFQAALEPEKSRSCMLE